MKALVCSEHGLADKLNLVDDWPTSELGEHDVRIQVKAASLNFPDVLIIQGKYQFNQSFHLFQEVRLRGSSRRWEIKSHG